MKIRTRNLILLISPVDAQTQEADPETDEEPDIANYPVEPTGQEAVPETEDEPDNANFPVAAEEHEDQEANPDTDDEPDIANYPVQVDEEDQETDPEPDPDDFPVEEAGKDAGIGPQRPISMQSAGARVTPELADPENQPDDVPNDDEQDDPDTDPEPDPDHFPVEPDYDAEQQDDAEGDDTDPEPDPDNFPLDDGNDTDPEPMPEQYPTSPGPHNGLQRLSLQDPRWSGNQHPGDRTLDFDMAQDFSMGDQTAAEWSQQMNMVSPSWQRMQPYDQMQQPMHGPEGPRRHMRMGPGQIQYEFTARKTVTYPGHMPNYQPLYAPMAVQRSSHLAELPSRPAMNDGPITQFQALLMEVITNSERESILRPGEVGPYRLTPFLKQQVALTQRVIPHLSNGDSFYHRSQMTQMMQADAKRRSLVMHQQRREALLDSYMKNQQSLDKLRKPFDPDRMTVCMEVSHQYHIGMLSPLKPQPEGTDSIVRVIADTGANVVFPDREESSAVDSTSRQYIVAGIGKESSQKFRNQILISGRAQCVNEARKRIRALTPVVVYFPVPDGRHKYTCETLRDCIEKARAIGFLSNVTVDIQLMAVEQSADLNDQHAADDEPSGVVVQVHGRFGDLRAIDDACEYIRLKIFDTEERERITFCSQIEVGFAQCSMLQTAGSKLGKLISQTTRAALHFPRQPDQNSNSTLFCTAQCQKSVLKAVEHLMALSPLQLLVDVYQSDVRKTGCEFDFRNNWIEQYVSIFTTGSDYQPKGALECEKKCVFFAFATVEINAADLFGLARSYFDKRLFHGIDMLEFPAVPHLENLKCASREHIGLLRVACAAFPMEAFATPKDPDEEMAREGEHALRKDYMSNNSRSHDGGHYGQGQGSTSYNRNYGNNFERRSNFNRQSSFNRYNGNGGGMRKDNFPRRDSYYAGSNYQNRGYDYNNKMSYNQSDFYHRDAYGSNRNRRNFPTEPNLYENTSHRDWNSAKYASASYNNLAEAHQQQHQYSRQPSYNNGHSQARSNNSHVNSYPSNLNNSRNSEQNLRRMQPRHHSGERMRNEHHQRYYNDQPKMDGAANEIRRIPSEEFPRAQPEPDERAKTSKISLQLKDTTESPNVQAMHHKVGDRVDYNRARPVRYDTKKQFPNTRKTGDSRASAYGAFPAIPTPRYAREDHSDYEDNKENRTRTPTQRSPTLSPTSMTSYAEVTAANKTGERMPPMELIQKASTGQHLREMPHELLQDDREDMGQSGQDTRTYAQIAGSNEPRKQGYNHPNQVDSPSDESYQSAFAMEGGGHRGAGPVSPRASTSSPPSPFHSNAQMPHLRRSTPY
ncbi:unnamed protein product, partial [Mesorhabditis spiculigera]